MRPSVGCLICAISLLIGQPLSAQGMLARFPTITNDSTFLSSLRASSQPRLLLFAEESESPIVDSASELIKDDELAVLNLSISLLLNQNHDSRRAADALRSRFGLGPDVQWAVVGTSEQLFASGQALPSAAELAQMLAAKGLHSPIKLLRDFLRANPDHLGARAELLGLQLASAGRRTGSALGIEAQLSTSELLYRAERQRQAAQASGAASPQTTSLIQEPTPIAKDKVLDAEADLQIWAGYADTFDKLFTGDDWIASGLSFRANQTMYEVCSPLVKGVYRRKIGMVEAALERAPTNSNFWSVWCQMADVLGDRSIVALLGRLPQLPGYAGLSFEGGWPGSIRERLAKEARANGSWKVLADFLWEDFQKTMDLSAINHGYRTASGRGDGGAAYAATLTTDAARERQIMDDLNNRGWEREWDSLFEPLLESLIRMNDLGRAGTIMDELQKRQQAGDWSQSQMQKAIALANRCERPDIAGQWAVYVSGR